MDPKYFREYWKERVNTLSTLDELAEEVVMNFNTAYKCSLLDGVYWSRGQKTKLQAEEIEFRRVYYSDSLSNMHSAPIGQYSNFLQDERFPTSFPGYSLKLKLKLSQYCVGFASNVLRLFYLNTGTGGAAGVAERHMYEYDCTIWLDDLPVLAEEMFFKKLKSNGRMSLLLTPPIADVKFKRET